MNIKLKKMNRKRLEDLVQVERVLSNIDVSKVLEGVNLQQDANVTQICILNCMNLVWEHPEYSQLAGRIVVYDLHCKLCIETDVNAVIRRTVDLLFEDQQITREIYDVYVNNANKINEFIDFERDHLLDYFGVSTLINGGYLRTVGGKIIETPQLLFLRVAIQIHGNDIEAVRETYDAMSLRKCIHATPTLFHSCSTRPQLASCFLLQIEDSIDDMYNVAHKCALISKYGGGIGIAMHKIRSQGAMINTSRGRSTGMMPYLKVLDALARHVDQGGKRPGSIAVYLEPWHADIETFIKARHPTTLPEQRAEHLNYALWTNDLFMERVQTNGTWSLFCPGDHPELVELVGQEFKETYIRLESEGKYKKQMPAQELWSAVLKSQIETGMPYLLYKDACNLKSNQKNLGTIYCSNLCAEVVEHTSSDETAVCNLASIGLPAFYIQPIVERHDLANFEDVFNFNELGRITRMLVRNLNKLIDSNYYTTECARNSNTLHRPIGIGVQGYADLFAMAGVSWESDEAKAFTEKISACIYYNAMLESCNLAKQFGVYSSFPGSPISRGEFQFDLWGVNGSIEYGWDSLRQEIIEHGLRNSLCVALMPTASTSNILGYNETFEPFTFNLYTRRTLAGEFMMINKYLVRDLLRLGLWDRRMYERLVSNGGSIQKIQEIPENIRNLYKTARELRKVPLLELAAIRGKYVCQTQSMNLYIEGKNADVSLLHNCHMKSWKLGLKTSSYYVHSLPATKAANVVETCESCSA